MGAPDCQLPTCRVWVDGQILTFVVTEVAGVPIRVLPATVDNVRTWLIPFTDIPLYHAALLRDMYRKHADSLDTAILAQLGGLQS